MHPPFLKLLLRLSIAAYLMLLSLPGNGQMVIGGSTPSPSALLDLQSTAKGLLPPRMTTAQRNAIASPAAGLIIFNTDERSLQINTGTPSQPSWSGLSVTQPLSSLAPSLTTLPGGTFIMGCTTGDPNCISDESPQHSVTLSSFLISDAEVTQIQWQSVMGSNPSSFVSPANPACPQCPVERVSWYDALVYCNRLSEAQGLSPCYFSDAAYTQVYGKSGGTWSLPNSGTVYWNPSAKGYRLPTEAEWEYAARGGSATNIYSGSNTIGQVAWYATNSGSVTKAVKGLFQNGFGLYDMSGNVWEWCWDWYDGTYYSSSPSNDPRGPTTGSFRVSRGGSLGDDPQGCRVAVRNYSSPGDRYSVLGFRLARTL